MQAHAEGTPQLGYQMPLAAKRGYHMHYGVKGSHGSGSNRSVSGNNSRANGSSRASWTGLGEAVAISELDTVVSRTPFLIGASAKPPSASRTEWPSEALAGSTAGIGWTTALSCTRSNS